MVWGFSTVKANINFDHLDPNLQPINSTEAFVELTEGQFSQINVLDRISRIKIYNPQQIEIHTANQKAICITATQLFWPHFSKIEEFKSFLANIYLVVTQMLNKKEYVVMTHVKARGGGVGASEEQKTESDKETKALTDLMLKQKKTQALQEHIKNVSSLDWKLYTSERFNKQVQQACRKISQLILEGADPNAVIATQIEEEGRFALIKTSYVSLLERICYSKTLMFGRKALAEELIKGGANIPSNLVKTLIRRRLDSGDFISSVFVKRGFDNQEARLQNAIENRSWNDVEKALKNGADPNSKIEDKYEWDSLEDKTRLVKADSNTETLLTLCWDLCWELRRQVSSLESDSKESPNYFIYGDPRRLPTYQQKLSDYRANKEKYKTNCENEVKKVVSIAELLATYGAMDESFMFKVAGTEFRSVIPIMVEKGANPNSVDEKTGMSILEKVLREGDPISAKALLEKGATPTSHALYRALYQNYQDIVPLLLTNNIDPNAVVDDIPILIRAIRVQESELSIRVVDFLIQAGADINVRGAKESNLPAYAKYLRDEEKEGHSPLYYVIEKMKNGSTKLKDFLNPMLQKADFKDEALLYEALYLNDDQETFFKMLESGAKIDEVDAQDQLTSLGKLCSQNFHNKTTLWDNERRKKLCLLLNAGANGELIPAAIFEKLPFDIQDLIQGYRMSQSEREKFASTFAHKILQSTPGDLLNPLIDLEKDKEMKEILVKVLMDTKVLFYLHNDKRAEIKVKQENLLNVLVDSMKTILGNKLYFNPTKNILNIQDCESTLKEKISTWQAKETLYIHQQTEKELKGLEKAEKKKQEVELLKRKIELNKSILKQQEQALEQQKEIAAQESAQRERLAQEQTQAAKEMTEEMAKKQKESLDEISRQLRWLPTKWN